MVINRFMLKFQLGESRQMDMILDLTELNSGTIQEPQTKFSR